MSFEAQLQVLDLNGQVLSRRAVSILAGNNTLTLDLSDFPAGLYFVNLLHDENLPFKALRVIKR